MLERGWDAVSVQDVCDRADVGRSTFYTHFADKEDLLVGGFDDLRKAMRLQLAPAVPSHPLPCVHGFIEHVHEQRRLFLALVGKSSGQVVVRRFRELVLDLIREDMSALSSTKAPESAVHFVTGGFLELLTWWLETKNSLGPADVEKMFLDLASPALAALRK